MADLGFLDTLNTKVFSIFSASSHGDKQSFLRLQRLTAERFPTYNYLEIGSDAGGSLVPLLLDPRCVAAISVDLRPTSQPDERGRDFDYPEDGEAIMIGNLRASVFARDMQKLRCFKSDISEVPPGEIPKIHLALIDGEHTNVACFSDADHVLNLMNQDGIIAFHDANLVSDALQNFERMLSRLGITHYVSFLPDCVAAIGIGTMATALKEAYWNVENDKAEYIADAKKHRWAAIAEAEVYRIQLQHAADIERQRENEATVRAENMKLLSENTALRESYSWKLTAPIRALSSSVRKLRR